MSFFARLFKKAEPETVEQKITKVEQLPQEQLLSTVHDTSEPETVKLAAINKLNYSSDLLKVALSSNQSKQITHGARRRIGDLLDNGSLSVVRLGQDAQDQSSLISLCGYSSKVGISIVEQISDESLLFDIAQTGDTTQIRQAAAEKINDRESLNALAKSAKNKDKSVLKIAKRKLDVFKALDSQEAEIDAKIDTVCKQVEQLGKREVDDVFHAKKKQIEEGWSELASQAKAEALERFNSALALCQQKLDDIVRHKQEQIAQHNADKEAKKELHSALHKMQEFIVHLYNHKLPQELEADLDKLEQHQKAILAEAEARGLNTGKENTRANELLTSARSLLENLKTSGPLNKLVQDMEEMKDESGKAISRQIESILIYAKALSDVPPPDIVIQSKQTIQEWKTKLRQTSEKSKDKIKETSELIRKANWAVSTGYVGKARALFKELENKIQELDQVPSHIENKFEEVKESMKKLGDWHEFAVTPKKEALVEKMQSLVDSALHPQDLAHKIHQLQDNWKELCKGGQNQDEGLWDKFHTASQTAYERCKVYFDEQTAIRDSNAALRLTLLTQLEQYESQYDWENANWKEVESTLKIARETWQSYWPVPRKNIKDFQQRFDGILDRIFSLRNEEFAANKTKKQDIVDQSNKLIESTEIQAAIDAVKRLQVQWQTIGRCKRADDQGLWKAFRANCDAVFEKREQENEALNEERKAALVKAEEILDQLKSILETDSSKFFEARAQCNTLTEQFQSIGELPKANVKSINTRYHKVLDEIEARVDLERKVSNNQQWQTIFKIADQVRRFELKCIQKQDSAELKATIETAFDNINKWPSNTILNALQSRVKMATRLDASTVPASNELLRILCIRSEILTNNETPENEKAYRLTYQVNQLKDAFGQASSNPQNARTELLNDWLNTPAASDEQYSKLLQRFSKCWDLPIE